MTDTARIGKAGNLDSTGRKSSQSVSPEAQRTRGWVSGTEVHLHKLAKYFFANVLRKYSCSFIIEKEVSDRNVLSERSSFRK